MAATPGPWDIQNKGRHGLPVYGAARSGPRAWVLEVVQGIDKEDGTPLPTIATVPDLTREDYANARLMAAAPEMLAALEGFVQRVSALKTQQRRPVWLDACMREAEAALVKAKEERR